MLKVEGFSLNRVGEVYVELNAIHQVMELNVIGSARSMIALIDSNAPIIKKKFLLINNVWTLEYNMETLRYLVCDQGFYLFEFI